MIDTLAPLIGMGIIAAVVALFCYLATDDEEESEKKPTIVIPPGCEQSLCKKRK